MNLNSSDQLQKTDKQFRLLLASDGFRLVTAITLILVGLGLGFNGLKLAFKAYGTTVKKGISQQDRDIYRNLDGMTPIPLPEIKESLDRLAKLSDGAFDVTIAPSGAADKKDQGKPGAAPQNNQPAQNGGASGQGGKEANPIKGKIQDYTVYGDRIGSYIDVTLNFKGEIYDQLFFMEEFYRKMPTIAVVKAIKGAPDKFEMEVRLYGK